jgi:transposase InsO family protein
MCKTLSVSRSGFYSWQKRGKSQRDLDNDKLLFYIRQIHAESERIYGSPRVTDALRNRGMICNRKRIERLMREHGIYAKTKKKFKVTTHSKHKRPVAQNLIKMDFTAPAPNKVWTSDITYIWTRQGWAYLSVFMDLYSRSIVGWSMNHRLTDDLVINAFKKALWSRRPHPGLIVHSDRGSQYCSNDFKELIKQNECLQSMSSTGNCYDNAVTESFFHTIKTELVYHEKYETRDQAKHSIFKYIEIFYNRNRIHTTLGGVSPYQFEQLKLAA